MESDAVIIAGPTAAGKSSLALALAERIGGEIISVDSMQVYRGLDIGTAKPGPKELQHAQHHLIDVAGLDEEFDAAKFLSLARKAEAAARARGHVPIYCGGTGLYFKALLHGLDPDVGENSELRSQFQGVALELLLKQLEDLDPVARRKIDARNRRRVVRALEIIHATGKPVSSQRSDWGNLSPHAAPPFLQVGLSRPRETLVNRIDARVEEMFSRGLVEETRALLERGLENNRTAMQAIGYRQVVEFLRGIRPLEPTIQLVKQKTRQYAKRQMTWFRNQMQLSWLDAGEDKAETLLPQVLRLLGRY